MDDIQVKERVLEQGRSTGGDDDYDLIDYSFAGYVKAIDAINYICEDKHKTCTLELETFGDSGIPFLLVPALLFFERNEEGEFICNNDSDHKSARDLLRQIHCNWVDAKKMQESIWITIKDWKVVE